MYCRNCGTALGEGQVFCPNCGTKKLEETVINNQVQQQNINTAPIMNTAQTQVVTNNNVNANQTQVVTNNNVNANQTQVVTNNNVNANQTQVDMNNNINNNIQNQNYNQNQFNNNKIQEKKKHNPLIIVFIVLGVIFALIIISIASLFGIVSNSSNKLECKSPEGNITIMYNESEILGYTASKMSYNLEQQKEYAKQVGIDAYLDEFNDWFENNTSGTCTRNGDQGSKSTHDNEKQTSSNLSTENGMVIGDKKYGYITVPNNWVRFHDVDGTTSLQYTYAGVYIVSMDYIRENTNYTAKQYAQSYLNQKKYDSSVSGVTGSTVKIGKNNEYKAYQVYMYYPSDGTYLVTYWFETEDGVIRYLALEGPTELSGTKITDYVFIPESFSLNR